MVTSLLLLLRLAAAQAPEPVLIDRVVVIVSDRIITASDIRLEAELARRIPSPIRALRRSQLRDPTEALIEQAIIRSQSAQVSINQPTAAEVQERLLALRATFPSPDEYDRFRRRHGLSEAAVVDRLTTRLSVERYIHRNIDLTSQSAREGVDAYFERYDDWLELQKVTTAIRFVE